MNFSQNLRGELWSFQADIIIFEDATLIGDFKKFVKWADTNHSYKDYR